MFNTCQLTGMDFAFPDTCLTPTPTGAPVPITYPNISMPTAAIPTQFKCLLVAMPAHNISTTTPLSNGDEAGVNVNPLSGLIMGPKRTLMGSIKVLTGGMPQDKMLSPTGQNGVSPGAFGTSLVPSQVKVMTLC